MRKVFRGLGLSLATIAVLLVLAEVGTRVYLNHYASSETFRKYATIAELRSKEGRKQRFVRHYYLGYIPTPGFSEGPNRHDERGFRGDPVAVPKPEGVFRIACLGASTTYTVAVEDYTKSYPDVMKRELRARLGPKIEVVNAGVPNWQTWESLVNLAFRVLELEPDLVIVYHGVNDVLSRLTWPTSSYTGDNSTYRSAPTQIVWPSVLEHSALARVLLIRSGRLQSHSTLDRAYGASSPDYHGAEFRIQKLSGTYPSGIFAKVSAAEMLAANPPIYFRRNLEDLVALARSRGVVVVLATFATCPDCTNNPQAASDEYQAALAEMNAVVREVAAKSGAHLFDFAAVFPRDPRYFTDGIHLNEEGAALKGKMFADFLVDEGLVPER